jgi:hypothetical protein
MQRLLLAALGVGVLLGTLFYNLQGPPADPAPTAASVAAASVGQDAPSAPAPGTGGAGR